MTNRTLSTYPSFSTLTETLKKEIEDSKVFLRKTFEKQKTVLYWKLGRHISKHIEKQKLDGYYGKNLLGELSNSLELSRNLLEQMVKFYRIYPKSYAGGKLGWSHLRALLYVKDKRKRTSFEQQVINDNLSSRELEELIKSYKSSLSSSASTQSPKRKKIRDERGHIGIYKIKEINLQNPSKKVLAVDLGFNIFPDILIASRNYKDGDIVGFFENRTGYSIKKSSISKSKIFTYKSYVEKVLDGDTIWLLIELGFGTTLRNKVRLRHIDSPEKHTVEGIKTKKYAEKTLKNCEFVVIKTHGRDKFDRYRATRTKAA